MISIDNWCSSICKHCCASLFLQSFDYFSSNIFLSIDVENHYSFIVGFIVLTVPVEIFASVIRTGTWECSGPFTLLLLNSAGPVELITCGAVICFLVLLMVERM